MNGPFAVRLADGVNHAALALDLTCDTQAAELALIGSKFDNARKGTLRTGTRLLLRCPGARDARSPVESGGRLRPGAAACGGAPAGRATCAT